MFKSLKSILFFSHTGIISLAILVLAVVFFPLMTDQLEEREKKQLQFIVEHGADHIKSYFRHHTDLIEQIADQPLVYDYLDHYRELGLIAHLASFQDDLPVISYIGPDGFEQVRVEQGRSVERKVSYRDAPFFQQAMARPNEVLVFQDPALQENGESVIFLAYAKYHYFGDDFAGLLLARVPLRQVAENLLQLEIGSTGFLILEDETGHALQIFSQKNGKGYKVLGLDAPYGRGELAHEDAFFGRCEVLGRDAFLTHTHLDEYPIRLWAVIAYDELMAGATKLQRYTLSIFGMVLVLALLVSYLLAHNITTPLIKLNLAARVVARGKTPELIQLHSRNEVGNLVESFNTMIANLRNTTVSRDYYNTIVTSMRESLIVLDMEGRIQSVNTATSALLGYDSAELIGIPLNNILRLDQGDVQQLMGRLCCGQVMANRELIYLARDGREVSVLFNAAPMEDQDLVVHGIVCVAVDMTERNRTLEELRQSQARLEQLSITDELTGLFNRRGFLTMAEKQLQVANRSKDVLFLLFMDVDGLKEVNDTLGHQVGDTLIADAADLLRTTFRDADIVARMGGDEFAVLLVNSGDEDVIRRRLKDRLATFNQEMQRPYDISISYGMAAYDPAAPCRLDDLLSRADSLMYEQKILKKQRTP